ncbi:MAG: YbaN family protein [Planctomycetes bacterium]|nr:YbaN family protein [Planctomycetota bacterium]
MQAGARVLFFVLGLLFVILGVLGAFLPVLPTTPFMLVAAACFARSSERAHQWLLNNAIFGPTIREWQASHSIPSRTKIMAIGMMTCMIVLSLAFGPSHIAVRIGLLVSWLGVTILLLRLPTTPME